MANQFTDQMSRRTDAELLKIVIDQRNDYQPEALLAAEEELARRNLSPEQVSSAKEELERKKTFDEKRANEPLDMSLKILTAIFPGILQIILSGTYKVEGYDRKARELVRWTLYGFGFYFSFVMLLLILNEVFS